VIQGAIFVVAVLVFRRGIVGELVALLRQRAANAEATQETIGLAKPAR
jgi:hypothetical protein